MWSGPEQPSSVRAVPIRLPSAGKPGCQTTDFPFSLKRAWRLSAANFPPLYTSVREPVEIVTPSPLRLTVKCGTGNLRLTIANVAWSSNLASGDHSIRIIRSVKTVKRAFPATTCAAGSATGSYWAKAGQIRASKKAASNNLFMSLNFTVKNSPGKPATSGPVVRKGKWSRVPS